MMTNETIKALEIKIIEVSLKKRNERQYNSYKSLNDEQADQRTWPGIN